MTTETVNLQVNNSQALRGLDQVTRATNSLNATFGRLSTVLTSLALGSALSQTLQFADGIQDLSEATGLATSTILGFQQAIAQSGGSSENAQKGILKLVETIGNARDGNQNAIKSFEKIGISLYDLQRLSEEDILRKTVDGLAKITDISRRSALQVDLLGKAFRGVDVTKLSGTLEISIKQNERSEEAIKRVADAQDQFQNSVDQLKVALVEVLAPVAEFAASMIKNIELIKEIGKWILTIATFILSWTIIGKIGGAIVAVLTRIFAMGESVQAVFLTLSIAIGRFGRVAAWISDKLAAFALKIYDLGQKIPFLIPIIQVITVGIQTLSSFLASGATAWQLWSSDATESTEKVNKAVQESLDYHKRLREMGMQPIIGQGAQAAPAGYTSLREYFEKERLKRSEQQANSNKALFSSNAQLAESILGIRKAYELSTIATENAANAELGYAMIASDTAEQIRAQESAYNAIMASVDELRNKKQELGAGQQHLNELIDKEIRLLVAQIPAATEAARARVESLQEIRDNQDEVIKQSELLKESLSLAFDVQSITDQIALIGLYGDELERTQLILDISRNLQRALLDLQQQEINLINEKGRLTESQFRRELDQIQKLRDAAYERAGAELDASLDLLDQTQAAYKDWRKALTQEMIFLAESIRPAQLAIDTFRSVVDNIDSAIRDFVEKGKFSFKDFATSILKDMGVIIARALVMRAILGIVGIFSPTTGAALSSILAGARANGGPVDGNKMYLVGERGPELFMPKTAGNIVPNNQLAMAGGGGQTNVTYNINAVDASSFRSLVARDPQFIYNVTEVGRRSSPNRRLS